MVVAAPELSPLFRSDSQGAILALLLLSPGRAFTIAELARDTNTPYASTHREVQRLIRTGVVLEGRVGLHHQVTANESSPATGPLRELTLMSYGPAVVIPEVLLGIDSIEEAYLYGSWAARRTSQPGSPPQGIDVLIVGNPARNQVFDAAARASRRLGREVNPRIVSASDWRTTGSPFLDTIRAEPLFELKLEATQ